MRKAAGFQREDLAALRAQPSSEKIGEEPREANPASPTAARARSLYRKSDRCCPPVYFYAFLRLAVKSKLLPQGIRTLRVAPDSLSTSPLDTLSCRLCLHPGLLFLQKHQLLSLLGPLTSCSVASANPFFPVLPPALREMGPPF